MLNDLLNDALSIILETLRKYPKIRLLAIFMSVIVGLIFAGLWIASNLISVTVSANINQAAPAFMLVAFSITVLALASFSPIQVRNTGRFYFEKIAEAELKVADQPTQITPSWDLARVTLEAYFSRNLSQITAIFWLSVAVMAVGFGIIVWGITQAIQFPDSVTTAVIATGAGVITEFIGATFLFIYRSAIEQAINYSKTLERINSVGMAMKILDTMPDEAKPDDLKSKTKANLVGLLIQQANKGSEAG
jgi:hypothetical protein